MTLSEFQLQQQLKSRGYSITHPRTIVFKALEDKEALTMAELVAICGQQLDRATVYRTVGLFEDLGIIRRVQIGWKYKLELTDSFSHHHHHLTCTNCGKVTPIIEDDALEDRINSLAKAYHFTPSDHQIEIRGLCYACQLSSIVE